MMAWTSSGSRRSDIAVKPETSVNMTVTCLRSPSIALRGREDLLGEVLGSVGLGGGEALGGRGRRGRWRRRGGRGRGRRARRRGRGRRASRQLGAALAAELLAGRWGRYTLGRSVRGGPRTRRRTSGRGDSRAGTGCTACGLNNSFLPSYRTDAMTGVYCLRTGNAAS